MADRSVLVVGQAPDIHVETLQRAVVRRGVSCVVLDRTMPDACWISIGSDSIEGFLDHQGERISFENIRSVWWRIKPSAPAEFSGGSGDVSQQFRWAEWKVLLRSLDTFVNVPWVNPLAEHTRASRKPVQLQLASYCGLRIPETVFGNSAEAALGLFDRHGRVVYKTLSSFMIPPDEIIYTSVVTRDLVKAECASIGLAPGIFQEFVEKDHELRVTMVGDQQFCAVIRSQEAEHTSIDWRRDQIRDMYAVGNLDAATSEALRRFHQRSGLRFAAYDFAVDRCGLPIFLECNPGGQWLWLEQALGLPITDALADLLCSEER